jgi:hypothetical protein
VIQALDRTQPMLPLRPGQVERHTHDYKRNGTLVLSAALEVATGTVTTRTSAQHRSIEFLDFLNLLARTYPASSTPGRPRQREHPQDAGGRALAPPTPPDPLPLQPDLGVVDEPDRDLVHRSSAEGRSGGPASRASAP